MTDKVEKNTLIIFLKYPEAGRGKTRLAKEVGAQKAANIYSYMAKKIIDNVLDKDCYSTIIFYDPPEKENEIKTWLGNKQYLIIPQAGETLGDKIIDAFAQVFSSGADKAVIIGTDCIDISSKTITKAMAKQMEALYALSRPKHNNSSQLSRNGLPTNLKRRTLWDGIRNTENITSPGETVQGHDSLFR